MKSFEIEDLTADFAPRIKALRFGHTPGDWDHDWFGGHVSFADAGKEHSDYFMRVEFSESVNDGDWDGGSDVPEAVANAQLIASAPELLAALKLCERALEEQNTEQGTYAAKQARQAIARATGKGTK